MLDLASTAPVKALRWYDRQRWIAEHPGWTFADYDAACGADILLHEEYVKMMREAEKKAQQQVAEQAKRKDTPHA